MPGAHPTASAIGLTLWLIVAAVVGCAIASVAMVRAQRARAAVAGDAESHEVAVAGEAA